MIAAKRPLATCLVTLHFVLMIDGLAALALWGASEELIAGRHSHFWGTTSLSDGLVGTFWLCGVTTFIVVLGASLTSCLIRTLRAESA